MSRISAPNMIGFENHLISVRGPRSSISAMERVFIKSFCSLCAFDLSFTLDSLSSTCDPTSTSSSYLTSIWFLHWKLLSVYTPFLYRCSKQIATTLHVTCHITAGIAPTLLKDNIHISKTLELSHLIPSYECVLAKDLKKAHVEERDYGREEATPISRNGGKRLRDPKNSRRVGLRYRKPLRIYRP